MVVSDRPGRAGTAVGLLITQRSRVQIRSRYQGQRPFLEQGKSLLHEVCKTDYVNVALVHAVSRARAPTVVARSSRAEPVISWRPAAGSRCLLPSRWAFRVSFDGWVHGGFGLRVGWSST